MERADSTKIITFLGVLFIVLVVISNVPSLSSITGFAHLSPRGFVGNCENGHDDDRDGCIDMADPNCDNPQDTREGPASSSCRVTSVCGNGIREANELCDGSDLNGASCESQGFYGGSLGCVSTCSTFDISSCIPFPVCGNGLVEGQEECDDGNTVNDDGCSMNCEIVLPSLSCEGPAPVASSLVQLSPRTGEPSISEPSDLQISLADRIWVVDDNGKLIRMNRDGSGVVVWIFSGDFEGVVAPLPSNPTIVYVGREGSDSVPSKIYEIDVSGSTPVIRRIFTLSHSAIPASANQLEALEFVPDSTSAEGGYFLYGHQYSGKVYVFELPIVTQPDNPSRSGTGSNAEIVSGTNYYRGYFESGFLGGQRRNPDLTGLDYYKDAFGNEVLFTLSGNADMSNTNWNPGSSLKVVRPAQEGTFMERWTQSTVVHSWDWSAARSEQFNGREEGVSVFDENNDGDLDFLYIANDNGFVRRYIFNGCSLA